MEIPTCISIRYARHVCDIISQSLDRPGEFHVSRGDFPDVSQMFPPLVVVAVVVPIVSADVEPPINGR